MFSKESNYTLKVGFFYNWHYVCFCLHMTCNKMKLMYQQINFFLSISHPRIIVCLWTTSASNGTALWTVEEPYHFSCIFKHVCTVHMQTLTLSHNVKGSQGISATDWSWTRELIASQAGQLQSEAREAPPCLLRSKGSFFKALFGFCSPQQLNSTQKSLFSPFLRPFFSLFTFSDLAAFWQLIRSLCTKGNDVLNWIIGSFLQMSAHPPTQPQTQNFPLG